MNLATKVLDINYINNHYNNKYNNVLNSNISNNDFNKNINNVNICIVNNKINITWKDCVNPNWKSNIIMKAKNYIPISVYNDQILDTINVKNAHVTTPFIDSDIQADTLYCYRIFSEFSNSDNFYSGLKNIFFIYVYDSVYNLSNNIIDASAILQDNNHKFVTNAQISDWNNIKNEIIISRGHQNNLNSRLDLIDKEILDIKSNTDIDGGSF